MDATVNHQLRFLMQALQIDRAHAASMLGLSRFLFPRQQWLNERFERLKQAVEAVQCCFESTPETAREWLRQRHPTLGQRTPLQMLMTEEGPHLVESLALQHRPPSIGVSGKAG